MELHPWDETLTSAVTVLCDMFVYVEPFDEHDPGDRTLAVLEAIVALYAGEGHHERAEQLRAEIEHARTLREEFWEYYDEEDE